VSAAHLLSWFALGLLAGAAAATLVPVAGPALAFLITMMGLLGALLAHALVEDGPAGRGVLVRVAACYLVAATGAGAAGLWWMAILLAAGGIATAVRLQRLARAAGVAVPAFS